MWSPPCPWWNYHCEGAEHCQITTVIHTASLNYELKPMQWTWEPSWALWGPKGRKLSSRSMYVYTVVYAAYSWQIHIFIQNIMAHLPSKHAQLSSTMLGHTRTLTSGRITHPKTLQRTQIPFLLPFITTILSTQTEEINIKTKLPTLTHTAWLHTQTLPLHYTRSSQHI